MSWLGIDLGGTKIRGAVFDGDSRRPRADRKIATEADRGVEHVLARLATLARDLVDADGAVEGVGLGFPGLVDPERGRILDSSVILPGFAGVSLAEDLSAALQLPCFVDNDATAAGWGAYHALGAPSGLHMVLLTIGTGIGGAIVLDGEIHRGRSNASAEFGNMTIDWQGAECRSGNRGSLNTLASGTAMARHAARLAREAEPGSTALPQDVEAVPGDVLCRAFLAGDAVAEAAVTRGAAALGAGVANILNIFNPDRVVLSGGVCNLGAKYLELVREAARDRAFPTNAADATIGFATQPELVGVYGAACLGRAAATSRQGALR